MKPSELTFAVCKVLNDSGARYMVAGSIASMHYGEIRSTLDVDIVAELRLVDATALRDAFREPDFYFEPDSMYRAMALHGMFNIIDIGTAFKADIIVPEKSEHNEAQLDRARTIDFHGRLVRMSAPEDVILRKLMFFKEGESDKHLRDIASMFKVSGSAIDVAYIESWTPRLGVDEQWTLMKLRLGMP